MNSNTIPFTDTLEPTLVAHVSDDGAASFAPILFVGDPPDPLAGEAISGPAAEIMAQALAMEDPESPDTNTK
jgi:hypothetical protein